MLKHSRGHRPPEHDPPSRHPHHRHDVRDHHTRPGKREMVHRRRSQTRPTDDRAQGRDHPYGQVGMGRNQSVHPLTRSRRPFLPIQRTSADNSTRSMPVPISSVLLVSSLCSTDSRAGATRHADWLRHPFPPVFSHFVAEVFAGLYYLFASSSRLYTFPRRMINSGDQWTGFHGGLNESVCNPSRLPSLCSDTCCHLVLRSLVVLQMVHEGARPEHADAGRRCVDRDGVVKPAPPV